MPSFAYIARDSSGALASGTLVGDSVTDVTRLLRAEGKYPTSIKPAEESTPRILRRPTGIRVSRADVIQLATQLSIMIETGVTLSEALECIATQVEKPNVKALLGDLTQQVQAGSDFSAACANHPRSFPKVFVALIKASERTGMLAKLMTRATGYLRDEQEIIRRVRGALTYPAIMFGFAVSTTIFLLACVLPKFTAIYASKGAALPAPTKVLMAVSSFIVDHRFVLPVAAITLAVLLWMALRTPRGARYWHYAQLHLPLLGKLFHKLHLSRSLRTVGTMAGSGVALLDCVQVAQDLSTNTYFRRFWEDVAEQIQAGRQLSEPLFDSALIPRSVSQMIHSAEKGGKLAHVMEQIATYSEQELKEKIAEMTRYIEPLMIMIMGSIIGSVTIALLMPIFSISRVVAR